LSDACTRVDLLLSPRSDQQLGLDHPTSLWRPAFLAYSAAENALLNPRKAAASSCRVLRHASILSAPLHGRHPSPSEGVENYRPSPTLEGCTPALCCLASLCLQWSEGQADALALHAQEETRAPAPPPFSTPPATLSIDDLNDISRLHTLPRRLAGKDCMAIAGLLERERPERGSSWLFERADRLAPAGLARSLAANSHQHPCHSSLASILDATL
jgi:hypothetical protein